MSELSKGQIRLYAGDFNLMHQEWQADGSVIITLSSRDGRPNHVIHLSDPYGPNEAVLSESEVDPAPPAHIQSRLDAAAAALASVKSGAESPIQAAVPPGQANNAGDAVNGAGHGTTQAPS